MSRFVPRLAFPSTSTAGPSTPYSYQPVDGLEPDEEDAYEMSSVVERRKAPELHKRSHVDEDTYSIDEDEKAAVQTNMDGSRDEEVLEDELGIDMDV